MDGTLSQGVIQENMATSLPDCYISPFAYEEHEAYMSEIQLRRIVDKMATEASDVRDLGIGYFTVPS
jgi:hypothetical protein